MIIPFSSNAKVNGTSTRFADPARFSFALRGEDGHPFPLPLKTYDKILHVPRRSLEAAKVDKTKNIDGPGDLIAGGP